MSDNFPTRKSFGPVAGAILVCCLGIVAARIAHIDAENRDKPYFCANDASRWLTVKALVDHQTYQIDSVLESRRESSHSDSESNRPEIAWNSIDKVRHVGADGQMHFYSSKPPLLPTIVAGQYWALKQATGKSFDDHPFWYVRILLLINNLFFLTLFLWALSSAVAALTDDVWSHAFIMVAGAFGTSVTTFAVSLSNHLPAVAASMLAFAALIRIWRREASFGHYLLAGLGASFAAANELPALSLLVLSLFVCGLRSPTRTFLGWLPPVALVAAGFFGTNYLAHQDWRPAYTHRGDGPVILSIEGDFAAALYASNLPDPIRSALNQHQAEIGGEVVTRSVSTGRFDWKMNCQYHSSWQQLVGCHWRKRGDQCRVRTNTENW